MLRTLLLIAIPITMSIILYVIGKDILLSLKIYKRMREKQNWEKNDGKKPE